MSLSQRIDLRRRIDYLSDEARAHVPLFRAKLLSSLIPELGTGTYTFSRASIATMRDYGGIIRTCLANEARFHNARRVENLLRNANAKSNAIDDGVWLKWLGTETINGPNQYTETVGSTQAGIYTPAVYSGDANGRTFTVSFSAFKVSGTSNNYAVRLVNGDLTNLVASSTITLTGSLRRYSVTLTVPATSTAIHCHFRSAVAEIGRVIHIEQITVEDVTAQTNQNPSEYVSYGMGDDHGCGVDGVKWFSTTNGNTVASFVVTEAAGADIGSTGYLSEQEKTNLAWPSENLPAAQWTKNNITTAVLTTLIGGNPKLNSVKASSTSDVIHSAQESVTTVAADVDIAAAFFVAAGTQSHVFIRMAKGAESAAQFFNASTGAVESAITSGGTITVKAGHSITHSVIGGYWCHCIINSSSVAGVHTVEFGISNADGVVSYAAANTTDVLCSMTGLQFQSDHEIAEYIKTVSGTVTKAGDNLSYDVANIPGEELSMVAECEIETPCASLCNIVMIEDATQVASYAIGGRNTDRFQAQAVDLNDVITYRARSGTIATGHHKGGAVFSRQAGERLAAVNGVLVNEDPIDLDDSTVWSPATFTVGCGAGGTGQPDFAISNVKIYQALTAYELVTVTT